MAAAERAEPSRLIGELLEQADGFSFFQAVRLLEAHVHDAVPVGHQGPPAKEAVLLRPNASFGFPRSDLEAVEARPEGKGALPPYRMTVNFLGLYGTVSPLPAFLTEEIIASDLDESQRRDFLDLFHHRLLSLFYRCWRKYRHHVEYRPRGADPQSARTHALAGLGDEALRQGLDLDWERMLAYVGLLAHRGQPAAKLQAMVSDYLGGVPVRVEPFVERKVEVDAEAVNRLGRKATRLGRDLVLGATVRDIAGKFRVVVGPLSFADLQDHLPGGVHHGPTRDLLRLAMREPLAFDVVLRLADGEAAPWRLADDNPCRLGWTTWMGRAPGGELGITLAGAAAAA